MSKKSADEGDGCMILIAIISLAIGVGVLFGAPFGWFAFGVILLFVAVVE